MRMKGSDLEKKETDLLKILQIKRCCGRFSLVKKLSDASKLLLKLHVVVVVVLRLKRGAAHTLPPSVLDTTMVLFISPSAAFLIHPA